MAILEFIIVFVIWKRLNFSCNTFIQALRFLIVLSVGLMIMHGNSPIEWIAFMAVIFAPSIIKFIR